MLFKRPIESAGVRLQLGAILMGLCLLAVVPAALSWAPVLTSPDLQTKAGFGSGNHHCRFWGCVSERIPASVIRDHLADLPSSLGNLSLANPNGWSVGYYRGADAVPSTKRGQPGTHDAALFDTQVPTVMRGGPPAYLDPLFDRAVAAAANAAPRIAVSHIRNCSSGLCDIPNPHPFQRQRDNKHWLMGHNGTIDKSVLLGLIRPDFLSANPPLYGDDPTEWIDSDLYFLYMLQTFETFDGQVKPALGRVIQTLRDLIPGNDETLNFFLTDGTTLWAYREGNTLYYLHVDRPEEVSYSAVASQPPCASQGNWVEVFDGQLVTFSRGALPSVESIEDYFEISPALEPRQAGTKPVHNAD